MFKDKTVFNCMTDFKNDLHETNKLIREVILPQLVKIETELISLRKHVWPFVQARKEKFLLNDLDAKRDFFKYLDDETIMELLKLKSKVSSSAQGLHQREYDLTKNFC